MIHVVTFDNQHLYARQLDEMFRMRHDFYVRERGWTNLTSSDGRETDEFDNEHAVYLMDLDRYGRILSTFRLNPTRTPYLLADKLPEYLSETPPRSEAIWDLTRWMVAPEARRQSPDDIADTQKKLICGVMEFAVANGITHFTTLTDTMFVERIEKVWRIRPMGEPRHFEDGNGEAIALMIEAGPHVLVECRNKTGLFDSVLFHLSVSSTQDSLTQASIMKEYVQMPKQKLQSIQTAADHLLTELKSASNEDVDNVIRVIDDFTKYIRECANEKASEAA